MNRIRVGRLTGLAMAGAALGAAAAHAQTFEERFSALSLRPSFVATSPASVPDAPPASDSAIPTPPGSAAIDKAALPRTVRAPEPRNLSSPPRQARQEELMAYAGSRAETPRLQNPFTSWLPRVAPGSFAVASPAPETSTDDDATGALGDRAIASEYRPHARRVPNDLAALIAAKAHKHHVPVALAHAVVTVESNYNPHVTGRGATIGLMQIKHPTARSMGFGGTVKELYDPANNLEYGMRYLSAAHRLAKGDVCGTIMRYQGGLRSLRMSPEASVYCTRVRKLLAATPEGKQLLAGRAHAKQRTAEAR